MVLLLIHARKEVMLLFKMEGMWPTRRDAIVVPSELQRIIIQPPSKLKVGHSRTSNFDQHYLKLIVLVKHIEVVYMALGCMNKNW